VAGSVRGERALHSTEGKGNLTHGRDEEMGVARDSMHEAEGFCSALLSPQEPTNNEEKAESSIKRRPRRRLSLLSLLHAFRDRQQEYSK
jgi:hypothetical protein